MTRRAFGDWPLAWRLLRRESRAGELRVLLVALLVAVAASTTIGLFVDRLQRGMLSQSSELLGGDLALVSPLEISPDWLDKARALGLKDTRTVLFPSMLVHGDELRLASVRAVEPAYPLRGVLRVSDRAYGEERVTRDVPAPGKIWLAPRLFGELGVAPGDTVEFGATELAVERAVVYEPGRGGNFFALAPAALINQADLADAQVIQPGSRVSYQYLFAGKPRQLKSLRDWLKPKLAPNHNLLDIREGNRAIGTALTRAERFLGLASLVAVLLAGVAIAMASRRYTERHFDVVAMLRCMGVGQSGLLGLYLPQLAILGVGGSLLGVAGGWLLHHGLIYILAALLPQNLPSPGVMPLLLGALTGFVVLLGFALPPLLRLRQVPPLRVLRRELVPAPLSAWLVYGLALAAMVLLMWRYTGSARLVGSVLAGGAVAVLVFGAISYSMLRAAGRLGGRHGAWRLGLNNLARRPALSTGQVLAFGLTFMAMALTTLLRTDLLDTWQTQLPDDAPNHFAINIQPQQQEAVAGFFADRDIASAALYPMVRGRLVEINGQPVTTIVSKESNAQGAINRELNLTWSDSLAPDNKLLSGTWWDKNDNGAAKVSVESKLAKRLGIKAGDVLNFSIASQPLEVTVASIRSVQWDSFRPNFYMLFPPGTLDAFSATYMTSFYLAPEQRTSLSALVKQFPSVTVLELDSIMRQVRGILYQVSWAVEYVLLFVLAAGIAVLFATLQVSLDQRLHDGAVLRALGADRQRLRRAHLAEFMLLGLLAGILAAAGSEIIAYMLYAKVLNLDYAFKWQLWLATPLLGILLVGGSGYWGTRRVVNQSPLRVLREH